MFQIALRCKKKALVSYPKVPAFLIIKLEIHLRGVAVMEGKTVRESVKELTETLKAVQEKEKAQEKLVKQFQRLIQKRGFAAMDDFPYPTAAYQQDGPPASGCRGAGVHSKGSLSLKTIRPNEHLYQRKSKEAKYFFSIPKSPVIPTDKTGWGSIHWRGDLYGVKNV